MRSFLARAALMILAACGSSSTSGGEPDGSANEASTHAQDGSTADSRMSRPDGHTSDGARGAHDASHADAREGGTANDAGDAGSPNGDSGSATDADCLRPRDGGHYVAFTWNETCDGSLTDYTIAWGPADGGQYPHSLDAGDTCDATACQASGQRSCGYDLRGLEAGSYCIVAEACNGGACSLPSASACVVLPPTCH